MAAVALSRTELWPGRVRGRWPVSVPGLVFTLSLATMACAFWWPHYNPADIYRDFVAGVPASTDVDKGKDFRFLEIFCAVAAVLGLSLSAVTSALANGRAAVARAIDLLLSVALLPFTFWVVFSVCAGKMRTLPVEAAAAQSLTFLVLLGLLRWRRGQLGPDELLQIGFRVLLICLLAVFGALGVVTFSTRFLMLYRIWAVPSAVGQLISAALVLAVVAVGAILALSSRPERLIFRLDGVLLAVQAFLPPLYFILLPPARFQGTRLIPEPRSALLVGLLLALAIFCWLQVLFAAGWHWQRRHDWAVPRTLRAALLPLCLGAVAVFMQFYPQTAVIALAMSPQHDYEYFHWGEQLLPWQQLVNFGEVPYVEFIPIHGLMPLICGALNALFFGNGLAGYYSAFSLWIGIATLLGFLIAWRVWELEVALLYIFAVSAIDRQLLVAPAIFLLSAEALTSRRTLWLCVWLVLCPVMVLYNGAIGSAFTMASIPVAAWQIFALTRARDYRGLLRFGYAVACLVIVLLAPSIFRMAFGLLVFLRENQQVNTLANGINWSGSWIRDVPEGAVVALKNEEWLRLGWVAVAFVAAVIFLREWARPPGRRRTHMMVYAVLAGGTLILISPWALNRIDLGGGPSRLGGVTYLAVVALMPALCDLRRRPIALLIGLAVGIGMMNQYLGGISSLAASDWIARATLRQEVSPTALRVNGDASGFPKLDGYYAEPGSLDHLGKLRELLGRFLQPGETYFDLTNNQGLYYLLDRRVPGLYAAPYVAGSSAMQLRMIARLEAEKPPVVLTTPMMRFDGLTAALRTPLLYHYVLDHYLPFDGGDYLLMVRPDRLPAAARLNPVETVRQLERAFYQPDLQMIPAAWGASWATLREHLKEIAPVKLTRAGVLLNALVWDGQGGLQVDAAAAFSEATYLAANPDVAAGVANGSLHSGAEHYRIFGHNEHRLGAHDPFLIIDLSTLGLAGDKADFLALDLEPANPGDHSPLRTEFRWQSELAPVSRPAGCFLLPGRNLVPLGSYPGWTLARHIGSLRLNFDGLDPGRSVRLHDLRLLKRQD